MSKIHAKYLLEIEDNINAGLILNFFNFAFYMYHYQLNINNVTLRIVVTTVQIEFDILLNYSSYHRYMT